MRQRIVWLRIKDRWFFFQKTIGRSIDSWALLFSLLAVILVIYDFGFFGADHQENFIHGAYAYVFTFFFLLYALRIIIHLPSGVSRPLLVVEFFTAGLLLVAAGFQIFSKPFFMPAPGWWDFFSSRFFIHALPLALLVIEVSRGSIRLLRIRFNPSLIYVLSFLFLIVIGTGLLLLPRATFESLSFVDALFTATSAVCVTGLVVLDPAVYFSPLGHGIILFLVQIGGLGVMVFTSFFGFFFQGSQTFQSQILLKDFVNEENLDKIFKTLLKILVFTFSVEVAGAIVIFQTFAGSGFEFSERIWYSVFHSVSAFCNAGFSVFPDGLFQTTAGINTNFDLHLVIALLVVIGGIGFPVVINFYYFLKYWLRNTWNQLTGREKFHHIPRVININSRIVVATTVALLVAGTFGFWFFENNNSLQGMNFYGKLVTSFFGAVTPRTAGFHTFDVSALALPTLLMFLFLMWVGASPSSTGGGIKTSTLALAFLNVWNLARGKENLEVFRREITSDSTRRAFAIIMMSVLVIGLAVFSLAIAQPHIPLRAIVFESISAFSTVGLSMGITPLLNDTGKMILVITMFVGRIGTITILVAIFRRLAGVRYRFPSEHIYIN
jgi:trk system potassium uptake protein